MKLQSPVWTYECIDSPQIVDGPKPVCELNPKTNSGVYCDSLPAFARTSVAAAFERASQPSFRRLS